MNYSQLKTRGFLGGVCKQNIEDSTVLEAMKSCYENTAFSTFPYIAHHMNSEQAMDTYNSGNCVALSMYVKNYLWDKHKIKSYLIPATIPRKFSRDGYLRISHVALAVPKDNEHILVVDAAFYFINPIKVDTTAESIDTVFLKNIYKCEESNNIHDYITIDKIQPVLTRNKQDKIFNKYQTIPRNTFICECNFITDPTDKWHYFLIEVLNPDRAISTFFINCNKNPFICSTKIDDNGICTSNFYLKFIDRDSFKISFECEPPITCKKEDIEPVSIDIINKMMDGFFKNQFETYITKTKDDGIYTIND